MKKIFKISVPFMFALLMSSACTQVLDPNYAQLTPQLVVEGLLLKDSFCTAKLSMTKNYYDTNPAPSVTTGLIILEDNVGNKDTLFHIANGVYKNDNLKGVVGNVYTLTVQVNGTSYVAQSTLPDVHPIDSLTYIYDPGSAFSHAGYYPVAYLEDPANQVNFYLLKFYRNDSLLGVPRDIWVSDDQLLSQNVSGFRFPYRYKSGDLARLELYSITKDAYQFYTAVSDQINSDGGFFSTPPANTPANFTNGAIGLFQAGTVSTMSISIP